MRVHSDLNSRVRVYLGSLAFFLISLWSSVCFLTQLCPLPSSLPPSVPLMQMFSLVTKPEGEITTAPGNNAAPCSLYTDTDTLLPAEAPCQPHLWVGSFAFFLCCLSPFYPSSMNISSHPNLFYYYFSEDYRGVPAGDSKASRYNRTSSHPMILGKKVAEVTITMI